MQYSAMVSSAAKTILKRFKKTKYLCTLAAPTDMFDFSNDATFLTDLRVLSNPLVINETITIEQTKALLKRIEDANAFLRMTHPNGVEYSEIIRLKYLDNHNYTSDGVMMKLAEEGLASSERSYYRRLDEAIAEFALVFRSMSMQNGINELGVIPKNLFEVAA